MNLEAAVIRRFSAYGVRKNTAVLSWICIYLKIKSAEAPRGTAMTGEETKRVSPCEFPHRSDETSLIIPDRI